MRGRFLMLAVTAMVAGLTSCADVVVLNRGDGPDDARRYQVPGKIDRLVVRADAGGVRVNAGGDSSSAQVREELHFDEREPRTAHEVDGDTLVLTATCPAVRQRRCWVDYTVTVHRDVAVAVETGAGNVTVDGTASSVQATTSAGDVRGAALSGRTVTARSDAGAVTLQFAAVPATVDASTSAGDVTVRLPAGVRYAVDAGTDAGDRSVGVETASNARHRVRARSGAGDVAVLPARG